MKTKLAIALLCVLPIFLLIVGCKNQSEVKTSSETVFDSDLEEQMVSDKEKLSESQSLDKSLDFLQEMTFYEVPITFPCKFKELCDNFTLGNGFYFDEADYTFYDLLFQGDKVASIAIDGEKTEQNNDKEVVVVIIEDEQLANLEIVGASCDVDIDTMIGKLGKPDNKSVGDWISNVDYVTDNLEVSITFKDNQADEIKFLKKRKAD